MLLVATAMAVLLAGCGSSQKEAQGSSRQTSEPTKDQGSSKQTPEPTKDERVVGHCADSGSTGGQQEEAGRGDGSNGKIVFTRITDVASDIYTVDEEGAHETRLTCTKNEDEVDPIWSPDGQKIAYFTSSFGFLDGSLSVMNADGTNRISLGCSVGDAIRETGFPAWSPDGQKIAYFTASSPEGSPEVKFCVINADGTTEGRLITLFSETSEHPTYLRSLAWSPDGKRIAFARGTLPADTSTVSADSSEPASASTEGLIGIHLINVDGTGLRKLTSLHEDTISQERGGPVWSPDGKRIAFIDANRYGETELNVINADGSGPRSRTNPPGVSHTAFPTWSPDSEKLAFSCPRSDLCVINADGTGLKRIATNVSTVGTWGRKQR